MKIKIRSYSHTVGEFNYHIQLTPAYRREAMENEKVTKLVKAHIAAKTEELKVQVVEIRGGPEHLHVFVANCKNIAPCKLIQQIKGFSSYMMRKNLGICSGICYVEISFGAKDIFAEALTRRQQRLLSTT